jgi:hypothetical protein
VEIHPSVDIEPVAFPVRGFQDGIVLWSRDRLDCSYEKKKSQPKKYGFGD